ncbi:SDR family NAD(P)-dependent oxidoreductase [Nocardia terpenica]|nr:SDR family oxidoreductase [Nocardia terpenica]
MKPTAVLTGASRGIGAAVLESLVEDGHHCLVIGRTEPETIGAAVDFMAAELSDRATVAALPAEVMSYLERRGGPAAVLVNNAGGGYPCPADVLDPETAAAEVTLNLLAPMMLVRAVLPGMIAAGAGTIVNVASTAERPGVPYLHAYSASKSGLVAYTQSLAAEVAPKGIRANCVCPGAVATEMATTGRAELARLHGLAPGGYEAEMARRTGLDRLLDPREVAAAVRWLCSAGSGAVNGQTINVCGTLSMR